MIVSFGCPGWAELMLMAIFLAIFLGGILCVILALRWLLKNHSTDNETRCRKCGYILRGITEPRCPECGERI